MTRFLRLVVAAALASGVALAHDERGRDDREHHDEGKDHHDEGKDRHDDGKDRHDDGKDHHDDGKGHGGDEERECNGDHVGICHLPPGNRSNVQHLVVGSSAVRAHVEEHGDGVCGEGNSDCCFVKSTGKGICTSLGSDAHNCGACGHACLAGQSCGHGVCACPAGQTVCGGACVATSTFNTDAHNCGSCGHACQASQVCGGGVCGCPTGQTMCGGVCTANSTFLSDANNCGSCGHACPAGQVCGGGVCGCPAGQTLCGGVCTANSTFLSDANNCGSCGHACTGGEICDSGTCGCAIGQSLCGGVCVANSTFQGDANNCGSCGHACPAGQVCGGGVCGCPAGQTLCGGVCTANSTFLSDANNCGSCGHVCTGGEICDSGTCGCAIGQTLCGGVCTANSSFQTDVNNCGSCGHVCPAGDVCTAGACACPTGQSLCNGACVATSSFQTDPSNCGSCNNVCPAGDVCTAGACACPAGQSLCNGACVATSSFLTDNNNCGACGKACLTGQVCSTGQCLTQCSPGQIQCGTSCVNPFSDPNNCGGCGTVCTSTQVCSGGSCAAACGPGQVSCSGSCASTDTDPNNCGACGVACASGQACAAGACVSVAVATACLPSSSLSVLLQGPDVTAYVPNAFWGAPSTDVQVVPIEGAGVRATIATPLPVNSCASNSVTGQTVCSSNGLDVYVVESSTLTSTLTSAATGYLDFTGGSCQTCGVAIDSSTNTAWITVGTSAQVPVSYCYCRSGTCSSNADLYCPVYQDTAGAFQPLDLTTNTLGTPIPAHDEVSEDIAIDPGRKLLLSPNEKNVYQLMRTDTNVVYDNTDISVFKNAFPLYSSFSGSVGEFDSAAEDCTTGIALASAEFTGFVYLTDLTQATFTEPSASGTNGSWTAPFNPQYFPEFENLSAGTSGIVVAPGSHLAIVTGEFGGNLFGVVRLPSSSGSGVPTITDYVAASAPPDPSGAAWTMGNDPHTVTAYTSPSTGRAFALVANLKANVPTYLAVIDLEGVLAAPRLPGTNTVDPAYDLASHGVVTFVSVR